MRVPIILGAVFGKVTTESSELAAAPFAGAFVFRFIAQPTTAPAKHAMLAIINLALCCGLKVLKKFIGSACTCAGRQRAKKVKKIIDKLCDLMSMQSPSATNFCQKHSFNIHDFGKWVKPAFKSA